jgi:hypothetical protein
MCSCPHCGRNVPARAVWQGYGLSGIVCPHCNTSLEPKYWSSFLLLLVSWSLAWLVRFLLVRAGVGMPWPVVGPVGALLGFYALLLPLILRLRLKRSRTTTLMTPGA